MAEANTKQAADNELWKIERRGEALAVVFQCDITEQVMLDQLADELSQDGVPLIFDTYGVRRINSVGVAEWIRFMRRLAGRDITFERCSPAIVHQLSTIDNFGGQARVSSVVAPYYCGHCGIDRLELLEIPDSLDDPDSFVERQQSCDELGEDCELEFDEIPANFFRFATRKSE